MRINNSYTQYRQPNFGRLKSIKFNSSKYLDLYPEETAKLLRTIKESSAFNEFFKKYDVDLLLCMGTYSLGEKNTDYVDLTLTTTVPKTEGNNWYPKFEFSAKKGDKEILFYHELINILTQRIKDVEFLDLKYKLEDSLRELAEKEQNDKLAQKARTETDDIINSLLSQELTDAPKKKTFWVKLFDWLLLN